MEVFLIKAAQLVLALVLLVTIHEFGHYIFARIFGMRVSKFYLFFNPWFSILKYDPRKNTLTFVGWTKKTLKPGATGYTEETKDVKLFGKKIRTKVIRKKNPDDYIEEPRSFKTFRLGKAHPAKDPNKPTWRDTIYGLGWLPLGGYCAIDGMIDETTDSSQLSKEPQPWEFRSKKAWQRLLVMMAGVIMNFVLAIAIYIGIAFYWGDPAIPYDQVTEGWNFSPELKEAGFQDSDMPIMIDGKKIDEKDDFVAWKLIQDGAEITAIRNHQDTIMIKIPQGTTVKYADPDHQRSPITLRIPVVVSKVMPGEGAEKAGLQVGDRIVKVGNDTVPATTLEKNVLLDILANYKDKDVKLGIIRNGEYIEKDAHVNDSGQLGVALALPQDVYPITRIEYGFFESIPVGIKKGTERLTTYVSSLKLLFTKQGAKSVGGFGAIGDMFPEKWNWEQFWNLTAFLSVILAFMNILPIPALDGGHVLFTLYEIVTRRKPSEKFLEYAQMIGMLFLFLLLIYANFNDIYRLVIK